MYLGPKFDDAEIYIYKFGKITVFWAGIQKNSNFCPKYHIFLREGSKLRPLSTDLGSSPLNSPLIDQTSYNTGQPLY
jgi:hypothetical protein